MPSIFEMERHDEHVSFNSAINYVGPTWQLDSETDTCMLCGILFTFTRRKHHCRMCGKIFCGDCTKHRIPIPFHNNLISRACLLCCKKSNLTKSKNFTAESHWGPNTIHPLDDSYRLPPIVVQSPDGEKHLRNNLKEDDVMKFLTNDKISAPVTFVINSNLVVMLKVIKLSKFPGQSYWLAVTMGMQSVSHDEVVMVLQRQSTESVPLDLFLHFTSLYKEASFGNRQHHMTCSEPHRGKGYFFLYLNIHKLLPSDTSNDHTHHHHHHHHHLHPFQEIWNKFSFVPRKDFLLSVLMNEKEFEVARMLPLRIMLRAASDQGYYPYPVISRRWRKSMFSSKVRSIVDDYREYLDSFEPMDGLNVMLRKQNRELLVEFPRSSYNKVMRCLNQSQDNIILLNDFNEDSCRHLTCFHKYDHDDDYKEDDDDDDHKDDDDDDDNVLITLATSCEGNDWDRQADFCGVSFLIIKRSPLLERWSFKAVEDGVVLELGDDCFDRLKDKLRNMKDLHLNNNNDDDDDDADNNNNNYAICVVDDDDDNYDVSDDDGGDQMKQSLNVSWTDKVERLNVNSTSEIDGNSMEGVKRSRIEVTQDDEGVRQLEKTPCFQIQSRTPVVRWLEVFFLEANIPDVMEDDFNLTGFVEKTGSTCCKVLQGHASLLDRCLTDFAIRLTIKGDKVLVESGSSCKPLPDPCRGELEEVLCRMVTDATLGLKSPTISTTMGFQSPQISISCEFVFRVLSINSTFRNCPSLVID